MITTVRAGHLRKPTGAELNSGIFGGERHNDLMILLCYGRRFMVINPILARAVK